PKGICIPIIDKKKAKLFYENKNKTENYGD
ncbi:unnamed protein product, partial [marine sediment metagenome]